MISTLQCAPCQLRLTTRTFMLLCLVWLGIPYFAAFAQQTPTSQKAVKVYEYTFLKSLDPKPDKAIEYITKNWFAQDKIAAEQGLLLEYHVFEAEADEKADWNIVVAVGYPTERGYEAIVEEFGKIRQQHKKILVDGKELKDLATIVGSRKLFPKSQSTK